ncbi:hypothetical protein CRUP_021285 [Coryphaenoides rupestris]|nr:hypothetical protein CRUP_021285 [Coryphaenoides rupestris]
MAWISRLAVASELLETRTARPFSFSFNTSDYRILHMDQDQGRLYLGSREYLVALDMHNIHWPATAERKAECRMTGKGGQGECANFVRLMEPWNRTHLYTCGTGAYKPVCTFINRGWRAEDYVFRLVPGQVDSGKGKCSYDPRRANAATLVKPVFVKIQKIPDSPQANDDKLYFFFREKSLDSTGGSNPIMVSRVGRVCLNDDGGQRSLVNKWTTFLKARLVCSDTRNPVVYAVFTTAGSVFKGSAVCVYSMSDIRNVFNGPFSHKHGHNYQWTPYMGKIPYPRPGTCPGGTFTPGLRSTKEFSDEAVNFVRAHPLMYQPVYPMHKRPLVVSTAGDHRFTAIAVDMKVIVLPKDASSTEQLILEEVEVFRVSLHRCGVYGRACSDCCLARDPYCAWDGDTCASFTPSAKRRSRRQDIKHGDPLRQCRGFNSKVEKRLREATQFGVEGSNVFLECQPRSPQASVKWLLQKDGRRKILTREAGVLKTGHGVLLKGLVQADAGLYHCQATENNYRHTVARIALRILDREIVEALTAPDDDDHHPPPPLTPQATSSSSQAEVRLIGQYCRAYLEELCPGQTTKRTKRRHAEAGDPDCKPPIPPPRRL